MVKKLTKKHDAFIKKCLTDLSIAKEFLKTYLPPVIQVKCNFNKLSIESGSYIEDDLKAYMSDIVYKVDLVDNGGDAYIYCLIEHQSSPDRLMSYRILRYQTAIIQRHLDAHPKSLLPLVVPIVFYNGTTTPYPHSSELVDLFVDKELFNQIGLGNFKLADLTVIEDIEIEQHQKIAFLEILVKHIHDKNLIAIIKAFQIAELYQINPSLIDGAIYYILSGKKRNEVIKLIEELKQNLPKYEGTFMNYAEELRQEGIKLGKQKGMKLGEQKGIKIGKQEGKLEAQQEIARQLLKSGVDDNIIATATQLSIDQIKLLK